MPNMMQMMQAANSTSSSSMHHHNHQQQQQQHVSQLNQFNHASMTTTSTSGLGASGASTATLTNANANSNNNMAASMTANMRSNVNVINVTMPPTMNGVVTSSRVGGSGVTMATGVTTTTTTTNNSSTMSGHVTTNADGSTMTANGSLHGVDSMTTTTTANTTGGHGHSSSLNMANGYLPAPTRIAYVRRGPFYGGLFDADHLATFAVGKQGKSRFL